MPTRDPLKDILTEISRFEGRLALLRNDVSKIERKLRAHLKTFQSDHKLRKQLQDVPVETPPPKDPTKCMDCWKDAANMYQAVCSKRKGKLTYEKVYEIAKEQGLTVPPNYNTFGNYCRRYWAWRNSQPSDG